jgi:cytochrome c oxidase assembly protein subunit 15
MNHGKPADNVPILAHRLFLFATVFTWPLLFVGGLVTTYGVGMAVPDWPTTFGVNMFLYDFVNSAWGVFIEHGHRLYGSAVGLCLLIVAPMLQFSKRVPGRIKTAAWLALAGVIVQGVMGGLRVTRISTSLAMVHGCFGQAFFAFLACLTAWTSRTWARIGAEAEEVHGGLVSSRTAKFAVGTVLLVYAQVVAGAWLRHFPAPGKLYLHGILGIAVVAVLTILGAKLKREPVAKIGGVRRSRSILMGLAHAQLLLGFFAWWVMRPFDGIPKRVTDFSALVRTVHQANGALVLAFAAVTTLWVIRAWTYRPATKFEPVPQVEELEAACPS